MGATTAAARRRSKAAARAVDRRRSARIAARAGLGARTVFYLLLAGLVARAAFDRGAGRQTNANGAMSVIAETVLGKVALGAAAAGFLAFGVVRLGAAVRDRDPDMKQRLLTAVQGLFYIGLTWVPLSFLFGSKQTGSEQAQKQQTASVLGWPFGRELIVVVGLIVIGVFAYQIRTALTQDYEEGLDLRQPPAWVRRLVDVAGTVGMVARAVVFLPIGVFLIVAAVLADPEHANGLDAELAALARQSWWGPMLLWVVAAGLVVFAVYSGLEARYRKVSRAE